MSATSDTVQIQNVVLKVNNSLRDIVSSAFVASDKEIENYKLRVLNQYVRTSGALRCAASYIVHRADAGVPVPEVSSDRLTTMQNYARTTEIPGSTRIESFENTENQAMYVFSNLLVTDKPTRPPQLPLPAQRQFYAKIVDSGEAGADNWRAKLNGLKQRRQTDLQAAQEDLEVLENERRGRLQTERQGVTGQLIEYLQNLFQTPTEALQPLNSGILFYKPEFVSSVNAAYSRIQLFFPCLAARYPTDSSLIESENYWQLFAEFVAARVRLTIVRYPTTYVALPIEARSRVSEASALQNLRLKFIQLGGKHVRDCNCFGNSNQRSNCATQRQSRMAPF